MPASKAIRWQARAPPAVHQQGKSHPAKGISTKWREPERSPKLYAQEPGAKPHSTKKTADATTQSC